MIVFSGDRVLHRVAADGGEPVQLTTLDAAKNEITHYWPWFLPDGAISFFSREPSRRALCIWRQPILKRRSVSRS